MERIDWILGTAGAIVVALFLLAAVAFAVEAPNAGPRPTGPASQSQQLTPAPPTPAQPPMGGGMGPMMGGMGMGPGMMMPHPCPCPGGAMGRGMHPMMAGVGTHGMMGMGMGMMLMAARKDPKGVALMMRMRADMLRLHAEALDGKAKILEKYANEIEAGVK